MPCTVGGGGSSGIIKRKKRGRLLGVILRSTPSESEGREERPGASMKSLERSAQLTDQKLDILERTGLTVGRKELRTSREGIP